MNGYSQRVYDLDALLDYIASCIIQSVESK